MRRCVLWLAAGVILSLALHHAPAAMAQLPAGYTELPCPEPKPTFDAAKLDRACKLPALGSKNPAFILLALGPDGNQVVTIVADESKGEGAGVDRVYIDTNASRDLTEPGKCFELNVPGKLEKPRPGTQLAGISPGKDFKGIAKSLKLDIKDPLLTYTLEMTFGFSSLRVQAQDKSYGETWHFNTQWSLDRQQALVVRAGGKEFSLGCENFVDPKRQATLARYGVDPLPAMLVIRPADDGAQNFERIEPFYWKNLNGLPLSGFEFEQSFTGLLKSLADKARGKRPLRYRLNADGQITDLAGPPEEGACG